MTLVLAHADQSHDPSSTRLLVPSTVMNKSVGQKVLQCTSTVLLVPGTSTGGSEIFAQPRATGVILLLNY